MPPTRPHDVAAQFAAHATTTPELVAIDDGATDGALTYGELWDRVQRVAGFVDRAVPRSTHAPTVVGILTSDARALVTASLAVARAGRVSATVDPTFPRDRRVALLADAGATLVLTDGVADATDLAGDGIDVVALTTSATGAAITDPPTVEPDDLSSILYTSGSTGVPKGVRFSHRARLGVARALPPDTTGPGVRSCASDVGSSGGAEGVHLAPLLRGGTLVPFAVERRGVPALPAFLRTERVTALRSVPTLLRHLLTLLGDDDLPDLRAVAAFGEPLLWEDVARLRPRLAPGAVVHNSYGSTETGVLTTFSVGPHDPIRTGPLPAGYPLPGRHLRIVDDEGAPVPDGTAGHLVAVGRDLPAGYWNRPIEDEATFSHTDDGDIVCRTGDRGVLEPDGCLIVLGRTDDVVKIAGHRVELGEVEAALAMLPGVADAAATARADASGEPRLLAYAVPTSGGTIEPGLLRAALTRRLPRAMVPDVVLVLDELPRLTSGKVDRRALPDRPRRSAAPEVTATPDDLESEVLAVFALVIDRPVDEIDPDGDFFDIGGDSLRAVHLLVALEPLAGGPVAPEVLMEAPSARQLAEALVAGRAADPPSCVLPVRPGGARPPLFFAPGANGQPWAARRLAELLPDDVPVFALQTAVTRRRAERRTLVDTAAEFVDAILLVEPEGPYFLFGPSAGGLTCFEVAHQLHAAGAEVGAVILGDTPSPRQDKLQKLPPSVLDALLRRTPPRRERLRTGNLGRALRADARRLTGRFRRSVDAPEPAMLPADQQALRLRGAISKDSLDQYAGYEARPLAGDLVLLLCDATDPGLADEWRALTEGQLHVHPVPGLHGHLLLEPGLSVVARTITAYLEGDVPRATTHPTPKGSGTTVSHG